MEPSRLNAYNAAREFLLSSIQNSGGSAAFYSRLIYPFKNWSDTYPETTGYLIPTLFDAGHPDEAIAQAKWIVSLQYDDGGLPGGFHKKDKKKERSIFNTAQMIQGLHRAALETSDPYFTSSAVKASRWLAKSQDRNGAWSQYHYMKGYSPSYYSRVAWPMLQTLELDNDESVRNAAIRALDYIQTKKLDNGFIKDTGFRAEAPAFLHTIAYTARGFLEAGLILDRADYWNTGYQIGHKLFKEFEIKKRLAGAYTENGRRVDWYRCLTGEAQICIIWMLIAKHENDPRFLNTSSKLIDHLCAAQPRYTLIKKKGGLAGSKPFFGRYIAMRQPNWASKFFMDALLLESQSYAALSKRLRQAQLENKQP